MISMNKDHDVRQRVHTGGQIRDSACMKDVEFVNESDKKQANVLSCRRMRYNGKDNTKVNGS